MTQADPAAEGVTGSRGLSELGLRVTSGAILVVAALLATWQGGWLFALLWLAAGIAILVEWLAVTGSEPLRPLAATLAVGLVAGAAAVAATSWALPAAAAALAALTAAMFLARQRRDRLWAVLGFAYAAVIAMAPPLVRAAPELGIAAILWMFAVVWLTDIAGFFVGRRLGGPKLWPRISPKKTWSGFLGGLAAASCAGTAVGFAFGARSLSALAAIALAAAVASVASQGGDLAESALKRRFGVKDSGRLIPGHGGVMDRLDGFWAVALLAGLALGVMRWGAE